MVWIVSDQTVDGDETGTSFRQALYFKEIGFKLNDTMIWAKDSFAFPDVTRYPQTFEYMFVFSKGKPKHIDLIRDRKNKYAGRLITGTQRLKSGEMRRIGEKPELKEYGLRYNVWTIFPETTNKTGHPAVFPVKIAKDHILSWSKKGDIVLDPFMGSGTTAIACLETDRHYLGIEISETYCEIAKQRIEKRIEDGFQMELTL